MGAYASGAKVKETRALEKLVEAGLCDEMAACAEVNEARGKLLQLMVV